ncbi:MAG TPA: hypothetical protein VIX13_03365, partial [Candidatus Eisenbacteria bacterium]
MAEWVGGRAGNGKPGGALKDVSAIDLGVVAAKAALERSKVPPDLLDHVVMGNALQTSGDAIYGARHVALKAGVPIPVPALTVNRLCGSGIQSIIEAAHLLQLGEANFVLAGGRRSSRRRWATIETMNDSSSSPVERDVPAALSGVTSTRSAAGTPRSTFFAHYARQFGTFAGLVGLCLALWILTP